MTELFLIAHCVRGEAAFDVATKMKCPHCDSGCFDCEELGYWWIIPTSGHRAFPYWECELKDLGFDMSQPGEPSFEPLMTIAVIPKMPSGWPDHYKSLPPSKIDIKALFRSEPKQHIARRL